ncbi:MAG TPA: glycoside hydrolase family 88 protein, partial [Opitutales bacterium]|nr:glycoside hydrolase family 88 protein [Opitutales bacterium]
PSYQDLHPNDVGNFRGTNAYQGPTASATPSTSDNNNSTPATTPSTLTPVQGMNITPTPAAVLDIMSRAADWQLGNPTTDPTKGWVNAAFYDGVMALTKTSKDAKYFDAMLNVGQDNRWQLGQRIYNADDHAVAQLYLDLYEIQKSTDMVQPTRERYDEILDFPKSDNLDFTLSDHDNRWSWADALFMDPPAWAHLSKITGDPKYLADADRRWWITSAYLYDKDEHLYYRDSTFFTKQEPNGQKVFWSRGNGWVIAGLARMLEYVPADFPDRAKFEKQFRDMAAKIKTLQQPDGLWPTGLLDANSHPQVETSGSGFFTYALAWGINQGLLDKAQYSPVVFTAWDALTQCVQADGKLIHVQPVGAAPTGFPDTSSAPYGVGAFLLAGSEVYKLVGGK